jgi:tripartite-type tricarboxylate transporter receptor subunit TctC
LLARAGTPARVIARLHEELARIGHDPEFEPRLRGMGVTPLFGTPAQSAEENRQKTRRWAAIVKAADLRIARMSGVVECRTFTRP